MPLPGGVLLRRTHATLALLGAWGLFFSGQLGSDGVPFYRDHVLTTLPLRAYINARLRQGELPQWYPYESLGVPLTGQVATTLYHPATVFLLGFELFSGLKALLLLAYLLALVGAYRLCRTLEVSRLAALTGAMAYAFGGYGLGVSSILHYTLSFATVPWVATRGWRLVCHGRPRDVALLALLWASLFLAGDAGAFLLTAGLLAGLWLTQPSRRALGALVGAGVLTTLLIGIEYLPARAVAAASLRGTGTPTLVQSTAWALHPWRLPELAVAGWLPVDGRVQAMAALLGEPKGPFCMSVFAGVGALTLALCGLRAQHRLRPCYASVAAVALWLSLGSRGGLLQVVQAVVPLLARLRFPEKYLLFFWLGLAPLVALGLQATMAEARRAERLLLIWAGLLAVGAAACHVGFLPQAIQASLGDAALPASVRPAWTLGMAAGTGFALAMAASVLAARRRPALWFVVPLWVFVELMRANAAHLPLAPRRLLADVPPFAAAMLANAARHEPPPRVLREAPPGFALSDVDGDEAVAFWLHLVRDLLTPDAGGLWGVATLAANLGAETVRYHQLLGSADKAARHGGAFSACYEVARRSRAVRLDERALAENPETDLRLMARPCRAQAFLSATQTAPSPREALQRQRDAAPGDPVVWEGGPSLPAAGGTVQFAAWSPEHVRLHTRSDAPTGLVISSEFAAGWQARIDGVPTRLYRTMFLAMGLELPAGEHTISLDYETPNWSTGAAMSGVGLLAALGLVLIRRR